MQFIFTFYKLSYYHESISTCSLSFIIKEEQDPLIDLQTRTQRSTHTHAHTQTKRHEEAGTKLSICTQEHTHTHNINRDRIPNISPNCLASQGGRCVLARLAQSANNTCLPTYLAAPQNFRCDVPTIAMEPFIHHRRTPCSVIRSHLHFANGCLALLNLSSTLEILDIPHPV